MNRMLHTDVRSLQKPDGSFAGDEWGEIDTRCCTSLCFNTDVMMQNTLCYASVRLAKELLIFLQVLLLRTVMLPLAGTARGSRRGGSSPICSALPEH